jgi:ferredoxin--NADP+ reductase
MMAPAVAIIGAGPAGFYTTEALIQLGAAASIDIIERLPTPFGLVRAGVAPDHQSTKQVARKFERTALQRIVRFLGNVEAGRDVAVAELRAAYDAVVLAVGSPVDRPLGIPGEDKRGVYGSAIFVGWYNGHPDFTDLHPLLDTRTAVIIGNGNVALDVARVLVKSRAEMAISDLPSHVAQAIERAGITDVVILGRRGPAEARFAPAELREIGRLADCVPLIDPTDLDEPIDREATDRKVIEKNLAILREFVGNRPTDRPKRLTLRFFSMPLAIFGDRRVEGIRVERSQLDDGRVIGTGEFETIPCGLVISAIGYRATPIEGVPFDARRGLYPNDDGRIETGLYVVGWAKRGPSGVIGTNRADGELCARQIAEDFSTSVSRVADGDLDALLVRRGVRPVTFADWQRIDAAEIARATGPAPRRKFVTLEEMLQAISHRAQTTSS